MDKTDKMSINIDRSNVGRDVVLGDVYIQQSVPSFIPKSLVDQLQCQKDNNNQHDTTQFKNQRVNKPTPNKNGVVIGLAQKLKNANADPEFISVAEAKKESFAETLAANEYFEAGQQIFLLLMNRVENMFKYSIYSEYVKKGVEVEEVQRLVYEHIITVIPTMIGGNLRLTDDEIEGMVYYLTGNCHIKWSVI